jgi:hypothetical protein
MSLVVYAEASRETNPGHMVLGQERSGRTPCYFGYRFDPADLPEEHRPQERWRDYLFEHAVPGKIMDETEYVSYLLQIAARTLKFPTFGGQPEPCYNCVKWAIVVANGLVAGFLPVIPQGRLKRILEHLQERQV